MSRFPYPTIAGQFVGFSATEEKAAIRLAERLSKMVGNYVDPYVMQLHPARGYWTHLHQDVQKFQGAFPRHDMPKLRHTFGCWDMTLSEIAKGCRFDVVDCRADHRRLQDFSITRHCPPSLTGAHNGQD